MKEFKKRFGRYIAMLLAFAMVSNTLFTTQAMASVLITEDVIEEDVEDVSAEEYADGGRYYVDFGDYRDEITSSTTEYLFSDTIYQYSPNGSTWGALTSTDTTGYGFPINGAKQCLTVSPDVSGELTLELFVKTTSARKLYCQNITDGTAATEIKTGITGDSTIAGGEPSGLITVDEIDLEGGKVYKIYASGNKVLLAKATFIADEYGVESVSISPEGAYEGTIDASDFVVNASMEIVGVPTIDDASIVEGYVFDGWKIEVGENVTYLTSEGLTEEGEQLVLTGNATATAMFHDENAGKAVIKTADGIVGGSFTFSEELVQSEEAKDVTIEVKPADGYYYKEDSISVNKAGANYDGIVDLGDGKFSISVDPVSTGEVEYVVSASFKKYVKISAIWPTTLKVLDAGEFKVEELTEDKVKNVLENVPNYKYEGLYLDIEHTERADFSSINEGDEKTFYANFVQKPETISEDGNVLDINTLDKIEGFKDSEGQRAVLIPEIKINNTFSICGYESERLVTIERQASKQKATINGEEIEYQNRLWINSKSGKGNIAINVPVTSDIKVYAQGSGDAARAFSIKDSTGSVKKSADSEKKSLVYMSTRVDGSDKPYFVEVTSGGYIYKIVVEPVQYDISVVQSGAEKAVITGCPESAIQGETVTLNVTAEEGYNVTNVEVTDSEVTKEGDEYSFEMPNQAVTVTVTTEADAVSNYTVSFNSLGGSEVASQTVSENELATEPTAPTRTGYTFEGWTLDGEKYNFATPVTDNITLVAQWKINEYTVSFDTNGGEETIADQTVSYNNCPKAVTEPTKVGHTFAGWTVSGDMIPDITTVQITEDTTFIAKWAKVYNVGTASVEHATITVDRSEAVLNEEVTVTVTPEEGYYVKSISANAIIASYDESEVSEEKKETFKMPASDVTVSAVINAIAYTPEIDATRATVSCNKVKYVANEDVTFTADSVSGNVIYSVEVKAIKADKVVPTTKDGDNYLFKMPAGGAVIVVKAGPVITVSENELVKSVTFGEGIVTVSGNKVLANDKTTATITLTAEATASNSAVKKVVLVDINGKEYEATAAGEGIWNVFQPEVEAELIITVEKQYKLSVSENALSDVKVLNDKAESAIGNNFENTAFKITVKPVNDGTYVKSVSANEVELYKVAAPVSSAVKKGATVEIDTYTMPANDVVISTEVAYIDYNVETVSEKATVSVNAIGKSVHVNDVIEFTVVADEDCEVYSVVVYNEYDKEEIEPTLVDGVYSFNMPASNVTITAKADKLYTIDTDVSGNGSVSINAVAFKPGKYTAGTDVKVVTTPSKGFRVERNAKNLPIIKVAGKEVEGTTRDANEFSFEMPESNVTVSVNFVAIPQWTVSFNVLGETKKSVTVDDETSVNEEDAPSVSLENYEFDGWMLDGEDYDFDTEVTGNITLEAKMTRIYTVTFNVDGTVSSNKVVSGNKVTKPADPTKTGYTFAGWTLEGEAYDFNTAVTSDITLVATWTIKEYTVTFDTNGGSAVESQTVSYNELAKVPTDPTKTGYTFAGWTPDIATTKIVEDTTFTAKWTANKYTVSFNVVNGSVATPSVEVEYGQKVTAPIVTPAEGYKFDDKWYTDAACTKEYDFDTEVTGNITLYAKMSRVYTVTFNVDGTVSSNKVVSGNKVTKPADPTKTGYTFAGWTLEGEAYDFNTAVTSDITLVATWTIKEYTVTFDTNGGSAVESQTVSYNELAKVPTDPTKTGYTFAGWTPDIATTYIVDDTTFTAQWTANKYTVLFNVVNGEAAAASVEVEYGQKVTAPTVTPAEGYKFDNKWYTDAACTNEYDFDTEVTEGFTLYAKCELKPVTTTFKVTFETNGGSAVASVDVKSGEKATKPADPTKTGYKFVGWFANSELTTAYDFNTVVTADITIYAKWEEVKPASDKYIADTAKGIANAIPAEAKDVIKYLLGDGTPSDKKMGCKAEINGTEYSEGLYVDANLREDVDTLEDAAKGHLSAFATKDGYASVKVWAVYSKGEAKDVSLTLGKKALDGTKSIICQSDKLNDAKNNKVVLTEPSLMMLDIPVKAGEELIIARNLSASTAVVLRAEFEFYANPLAEKFTVTFDTDGGSAVASQDVKSGEKATKPVDPTKAGYTFTGWTLDGVAYDFDKAVTGNITLKATWVKAEPKTYTVTFDSKGGSAVDSQTVTEGAKATKPADPTMKGYAFTGWTLDGVAYDFDAVVTGNITLVATWSKNKEVTPFPEHPESQGDVVVDDYTYTFENVKTYTGVAIKPEVLVKYGDTVLVPGVDYTVAYKNNKNISLYDADKYDKKKCNPTSFDVTNTTELEELVKKAYAKPADKTAKAIVSKLPTITIKGKGNYAGMNDYLYFNIVDLDVTSVVGATDIKGTLIYNGSAEVQKQNKKGIVFTGDTIDPIELGLVSIKGVNKKANIDKVLEPDVDYVYTIANNVNVGTANIFVKYMGDYVGEGKFTFKIAKADISTIETEYDVDGTKFIDTDYTFKAKGNKPAVNEGISTKLYAGADYKVTYKNNVKVNNYITKEDLEKAVKANNKKLLNTLPTVTVTGGRNYTGKFVIYFNVVAAELDNDVKVYLPTIKYNTAISTAKPVVFDADGNIVPASNYVFKYFVNVDGEEVEITSKGVDTGMKDAKGKPILAKTNAKLKNFGQLYTEDEINAAKPADQTAMKIENFLNGVYVVVEPKPVKNVNPVLSGKSGNYEVHNATNKLTAKAILTKHGKVTYFTEEGKDIFTGEAITLEGTSVDGKNYLTISSVAGDIAYDDCDVIYSNNMNKGTATAYIIPKVDNDNTKIVPGYVTVKFAIKANNLTKTYK